MKNLNFEWQLESIENGFLVGSREFASNKKFYSKLEDAIKHLQKKIEEDCESEFEGEW